MIKDVIVTNLDQIHSKGGNVMHAMKASSQGYKGFGEAYFSQINFGAIKAWKRHKKMTLNIIVPIGKIKFVLFDNREHDNTQFQEIIVSTDNYCRLSIPPKVWFGFQGLSKNISLLLNIADIEHNLNEVDHLEIQKINYDWGIQK